MLKEIRDMPKDEMRTVVILTAELWEKAKLQAMNDRVSLSEVVRRALREYFDKPQKQQRKKQ